MPLLIRIVTGLVVGGLFWVAFSGGFLKLFIFGMWAVAAAWIGLMLAAYWEEH